MLTHSKQKNFASLIRFPRRFYTALIDRVVTQTEPFSWPYVAVCTAITGPLATLPQINDSDIRAIVTLIRALQRANGFAP